MTWGLITKLSADMSAANVPDHGTGTGIKRASHNSPPSGHELADEFSKGLAKFRTGQVCICNTKSVKMRQQWLESSAVCGGPKKTAMHADPYTGIEQELEWAPTVLNNLAICFTFGPHGVELLKDGSA